MDLLGDVSWSVSTFSALLRSTADTCFMSVHGDAWEGFFWGLASGIISVLSAVGSVMDTSSCVSLRWHLEDIHSFPAWRWTLDPEVDSRRLQAGLDGPPTQWLEQPLVQVVRGAACQLWRLLEEFPLLRCLPRRLVRTWKYGLCFRPRIFQSSW